MAAFVCLPCVAGGSSSGGSSSNGVGSSANVEPMAIDEAMAASAAAAAEDAAAPPQQSSGGAAGAAGETSGEAAWRRLSELMAKLRVAQPADLFEEAVKLRSGATGYRKRPDKALPMLEALAGAADVEDRVPRENSTAAMRELGHMHLRGEGIVSDVEVALGHYERAAEQGDPESQSMLGVLHSTGFGAPKDAPLAATYLYFAAEGGDIHAQLAMGYRHLLGVSAAKACHKSLLYYTPVAEKVVASAQRHQAQGTIEKVRLHVDNPKGVTKRGADDDVLQASSSHQSSLGYPSSPSLAISPPHPPVALVSSPFTTEPLLLARVAQYYEHSALKGSVDAQLTLGHLHFHGARGLPADVDKAFHFYSKAAAAAEPAAFSQLGHMYAQGIGVKQDNLTALEYFRKGAAKDHPASQNGLGYMFMHGYGVDRNYKKAAEYFKAAAERGNADSQFNLGAMHIGGMGLKKAYDKALHYFTLSAHQGHTLALYNLAQMHLNGLGAPRSCPVGAQFLKAVAERGPWGTMLEDAHAALQLSDPALPLQLYATLAEGGFELAQANVAFLLDQVRVPGRTPKEPSPLGPPLRPPPLKPLCSALPCPPSSGARPLPSPLKPSLASPPHPWAAFHARTHAAATRHGGRRGRRARAAHVPAGRAAGQRGGRAQAWRLQVLRLRHARRPRGGRQPLSHRLGGALRPGHVQPGAYVRARPRAEPRLPSRQAPLRHGDGDGRRGMGAGAARPARAPPPAVVGRAHRRRARRPIRVSWQVRGPRRGSRARARGTGRHAAHPAAVRAARRRAAHEATATAADELARVRQLARTEHILGRAPNSCGTATRRARATV